MKQKPPSDCRLEISGRGQHLAAHGKLAVALAAINQMLWIVLKGLLLLGLVLQAPDVGPTLQAIAAAFRLAW